MEPTPGCKQASDDSASLHIAYQSVKILILRALLRPFHNVDHLSSELERNEEWHAARSQIRQTASAESDAALSLISSLQPAHYQAFWAPWLKTSFACIMNLLFLLTVTAHQLCGSEGTYPREEYRRHRQTLDRARMFGGSLGQKCFISAANLNTLLEFLRRQVEAAIGDLLTALQIISEAAGISVADLIDDVVFPDMDIDLLLSLVIVSRFREELGLDSF
ncbi:hypothetical protein AFCA_001326 [Aspergillus flavus]|nr:hypothetical protein AFCA_001326 [Aspergillus flavus]